MKKHDITIFCWNIGNPSIERAKKQVKWLLDTTYDVIILTETKESKGCQFIKDTFEAKNYYWVKRFELCHQSRFYSASDFGSNCASIID